MLNPESWALENGIQLTEPEFPLTTGHMRFLQLRPEFIFSSLISEFSPQVRGSKTVLDSGFHAVDCEFQLLDSRSYTAELGFRIPIVRGIPDSDSCIPDSKARIPDSTSKNFPRFRILHAKIFRIPESGFPYMGREFGNASKATCGVRCNIIIVQPQFANLFLIPCLDS